MRKIAKIAPILTLIAIMIMGTLSVSAYGYEISISSGNGEFSGGSVYSKGIPATSTIDVDQASSTVTIGGTSYTLTKMPDGKAPADSKYFMAGIKLAGDDNSGANSGEIKLDAMYKDTDLEFVVAYGMKSSMVSYTVHYVANGTEIRDADTFYGVAGDNVIVSYKYVDGYIPLALTGVATLSSNSDENDFTFEYEEAEEGTGRTITINDGTTVINNGGGAAGGAGGAGAGAGGAGAGDGGANIGDGGVPLANGPADTVNLNDNNTPLTENPDNPENPEDVEEGNTPLANLPMPAKIAGGAALVAAIAAAAVALAKRRQDDEEDEEGEDEK